MVGSQCIVQLIRFEKIGRFGALARSLAALTHEQFRCKCFPANGIPPDPIGITVESTKLLNDPY